MLLLIQPIGAASVMAGSDTSDSVVQHNAEMTSHQHFNHAANPEDTQSPDQHSIMDCCATAACCPAVISSRILKPLAANCLTQFEFRVSFQAITLPIEIKPPRQA